MRIAAAVAVVTVTTAVLVGAPVLAAQSVIVPAPRPSAPSTPVVAPSQRLHDEVRPPAPLLHLARASRVSARLPAVPHCADGSPASRGQRALAALRPSWRRSEVTVRFLGPKAGFLGETSRRSGAVAVYVRPCAIEPDALLRHVVAHELGHAWDVRRMTPQMRSAYRRARGISASIPWFGCSGCTDFETPAGDFAETYALWLRQGAASRSRLAPTPTPAELTALAGSFFGG